MIHLFSSDIAAISTPRGKGGIAVIRMSGEHTVEIASRFVFLRSGKPLSEIPSHHAFLADVKTADGEVLDDAVVTVFRAPASFTGEDTVEISCHGGVLLSARILSRAIECGAVQAGPGEFTRRAFVNGKIGLSQAEAVIGKIEAKTDTGLRLWENAAQGKIKAETDRLFDQIAGIVADVYAGIDFPEEDLQTMNADEIRSAILGVKADLQKLEKSYRTGHAVCEGVETVICGKPNTGKSTLLNLLCGEDRAIVTSTAGTTRDVITETVAVGDVLLRLCDTAGIRETTDEIEKMGVDRSLSALERAELILAVFDGSRPLDEEDARLLSLLRGKTRQGCEIIAVVNKSDVGTVWEPAALGFAHTLVLSARDETAKDALTDEIERLFVEAEEDFSGATLTGERQFAAVHTALAAVDGALTALDTLGEDTAGTELESALAALGEIDGRKVDEAVVDKIFHHFCVGK